MFDFNGAFVMPGIAFGEEYTFRLGYACARDVLTGGLAAVSEYLRKIEEG
jgi:aspartate/methionine/tyrosine aminotransferase